MTRHASGTIVRWTRRASATTRRSGGRTLHAAESRQYGVAQWRRRRGRTLSVRARTIARSDAILTFSVPESLSAVARGSRRRETRYEPRKALGRRSAGTRGGQADPEERREESAASRARTAGWRFGRAAAEQLQRAVAVADSVEHAALGWQSRFWLGQALQARRSAHASDLYARQCNALTRSQMSLPTSALQRVLHEVGAGASSSQRRRQNIAAGQAQSPGRSQ